MKAFAGSDEKYQNEHQELIEGCKKGDQKAQFQIYKFYYKAMFNTSLRIVNDSMEAEDIMQEAFLSAFEKIGYYSGNVSFGAWLKKIVYNRSIDHLNKKNNIIYGDMEAHCSIEDSIIDSHEESHQLKANKIKEIIMKLPEKYRNIISLYLFEGYDHEEIGEILSIPSSTSRSNYSRAKHKIIENWESFPAVS